MPFAPYETAAIVANGQIRDLQKVRGLLEGSLLVIAADGGLVNCDRMGIVPDLIVGDFDSAPKELLEKYSSVEQLRYPTDKDKTDLELAIELALERGFKKLRLFGALENRTDHTLVNLHLLLRYPDQLMICTERERIFPLKNKAVVTTRPGQAISLLPLGKPAQGVTTCGLKWEIENRTVDHRYLSISNLCLGNEVTVNIEEGMLICFLTI